MALVGAWLADEAVGLRRASIEVASPRSALRHSSVSFHLEKLAPHALSVAGPLPLKPIER